MDDPAGGGVVNAAVAAAGPLALVVAVEGVSPTLRFFLGGWAGIAAAGADAAELGGAGGVARRLTAAADPPRGARNARRSSLTSSSLARQALYATSVLASAVGR